MLLSGHASSFAQSSLFWNSVICCSLCSECCHLLFLILWMLPSRAPHPVNFAICCSSFCECYRLLLPISWMLPSVAPYPLNIAICCSSFCECCHLLLPILWILPSVAPYPLNITVCCYSFCECCHLFLLTLWICSPVAPHAVHFAVFCYLSFECCICSHVFTSLSVYVAFTSRPQSVKQHVIRVNRFGRCIVLGFYGMYGKLPPEAIDSFIYSRKFRDWWMAEVKDWERERTYKDFTMRQGLALTTLGRERCSILPWFRNFMSYVVVRIVLRKKKR